MRNERSARPGSSFRPAGRLGQSRPACATPPPGRIAIIDRAAAASQTTTYASTRPSHLLDCPPARKRGLRRRRAGRRCCGDGHIAAATSSARAASPCRAKRSSSVAAGHKIPPADRRTHSKRYHDAAPSLRRDDGAAASLRLGLRGRLRNGVPRPGDAGERRARSPRALAIRHRPTAPPSLCSSTFAGPCCTSWLKPCTWRM